MRVRVACLVPVLCLVASPGLAGNLPDPVNAKAAAACQKQIGKAGAKFVKNKQKKLDKCLSAIFKCIQTKEAAKQPACLDKAAAKCDKDLAKIFSKDELKLHNDIIKKCVIAGKIGLGEMLDMDGLDFAAVEPLCQTRWGLDLDNAANIAQCIVREKECAVERMIRAEFPRASELLDTAGVSTALVDQLTCLEGAAGAGDGFGDTDPKGAGKAADKCAKETKKAGAKFAVAKLKSIEKCLDAIFKCVQTKPLDPKCIDKATVKCTKELGPDGKIAKAEAKLRASVDKKCGPASFADLAGATGMHLDDLADLCMAVGAGTPASLADYAECLYRQHECLVDQMVLVQYPRTEDLLTRVGRAGEVPPAFCTTPTPTITPTPTPTVTVTPTPTITATPTPTATFTPAPGEFLIAINKIGTGAGTVTSSIGGIDCGDTCATSIGGGPFSITLSVETSNGSDSYFAGWSGDVSTTCTGPRRECSVVNDQHRVLNAHFAPIDHNLVFVNAGTVAMDLGSAAAYDAVCNASATAAGINNLAGDAFSSWISTNASPAVLRLAGARGFVRMDGKPFVDTTVALSVFNGAILHPIQYNEVGLAIFGTLIATGTDAEGDVSTAGNCLNFTSNSSGETRAHGDATAGPNSWTRVGGTACTGTAHFYCMMNTKNLPLPPPPGGDKVIYISNLALGIGSETPDARCEADKPAGMGPVKALISTTTVAAATHLDPGTTYARPDGYVVGTGAEIVAAGADTGLLRSGIWQRSNLNYVALNVWTGDSGNDDMTALGTIAGTCNDWTDSAGTGSQGLMGNTDSRFWQAPNVVSCASSKALYCVEQ